MRRGDAPKGSAARCNFSRAEPIPPGARRRRYALPIRPRSAISATFIARLIKGCRGDEPAGFSRKGINRATSTL
jgi:hypothetical protein